MGGDGHFDIPAVMVAQDLGNALKADLTAGKVVEVDFKASEKIEKPNLIDTLTSFSSKGPRSLDALLKPEISAPGSSIISAARGEGTKGVKMSGTSMAGPHIAGVMALIKQKYMNLPVSDLKSLLMGHALDIKDENGEPYKLSEQGAGRVQVVPSLTGEVVASKGAISLGMVQLETKKVFKQTLTLKNISAADKNLSIEFTSKANLSLLNTTSFSLKAGDSKEVGLKFSLDATSLKDPMTEVEGMVLVKEGSQLLHRIPVLAVVKKTSAITGSDLVTHAGGVREADGALVELSLKNDSSFAGEAYAFNLLGLDDRKSDPRNDPFMSRACDLQAVGYRVVDKEVQGQKIKVLQVAIKTYDPMTTWNMCEASVLIDGDGDSVADQELAGIVMENLKGAAPTPQMESQFFSVLLDAKKAQQIRAKFEQDSLSMDHLAKVIKPTENYAEAVIDSLPMKVFNQSSVMIVEADVTKLYRQGTGVLSIKVATTDDDAGAIEMDDFLEGNVHSWLKISLDEKSHAFAQIPEVISLPAASSGVSAVTTMEMEHGQGTGDLMVLFPQNKAVFSDLLVDDEMQIMKTRFQ
jgi:hypothetical protein